MSWRDPDQCELNETLTGLLIVSLRLQRSVTDWRLREVFTGNIFPILMPSLAMDLKELHQAEDKIGQRLRQLRLERSMTQEELAALASTKQAVIQKIENGRSKRPRILAELAIVLEVNPAWLQWGEPYAAMRVDI